MSDSPAVAVREAQKSLATALNQLQDHSQDPPDGLTDEIAETIEELRYMDKAIREWEVDSLGAAEVDP